MSDERVERYANALYEVATAEGMLDQVGDELFQFARAMDGSDQLRQTLTAQGLPPERRQAIVEDLLGPRALSVTTNLVSFIVGAGRARDLPAIVDRVEQRAAADRQREVAEVRVAEPLDDAQRQRLAEALSASLDKQVEVKVIVDPDVMGGVVAKVGDTVIDGTIRHRLDQLKERL